MMTALAHRGPGHSDVWSGNTVALGCRLLRTTPESLAEIQPLHNAASGTTIVADARIDNREALGEMLGLSAQECSSLSDSAIILACYERWGEACAEHLLGDFAFAIWDARKNILYCARDHFGVRPFVYCHTDRMIAISSEIGGVLALRDVPRRIDEVHLTAYLVSYYEDVAATFYRDIRRLPPAHCMVVKDGRLTLRRYWQLEASDPGFHCDADYADAFHHHFQTAMRCRMRAAVPIGSALSGGLNSSAVALSARAVLVERGDAPLQTFSVVFDDVPLSDERRFQQAALALGDMVPHALRGDVIGPLHEHEQVIDDVGGPFLGPNLFLHREMYRAARDAGMGIFLDGIDGDTTVSHGLARLTELARTGRWPTLTREVRGLSQGMERSTGSILCDLALATFVPASLRGIPSRLKGIDHTRSPTALALNAGFMERTGAMPRLRELRALEILPARDERTAHLKSLRRGLLSRVLELTDRASSAFSLEARYPFFDRRLIEFCVGLPADQKLRDGWSRSIMRRGLDVLPPEIRWRRDKSDLGHNLVHTLHSIDGVRLTNIIRGESDRLSEFLDIPALHRRLNRFMEAGSPFDGQAVMQAALVAVWLRRTGL